MRMNIFLQPVKSWSLCGTLLIILSAVDIIEASKVHNYTYIGRDLDPLDWVAKDSGGTLSSIYFRSTEIIERIMNVETTRGL